MRVFKSRNMKADRKALKSGLNGKRSSFRDLKAFGIWVDRTEAKNPVEFTSQLRTRMERGNDAR